MGFCVIGEIREISVVFDSKTRFKEEARVDLPLHWLSDLRDDLRYALRSMRRTPVFTTVEVLALGIGVGT